MPQSHDDELALDQDPVELWRDTKQWVEHLGILRRQKVPSPQAFLQELGMDETQFEAWYRLSSAEHASFEALIQSHIDHERL